MTPAQRLKLDALAGDLKFGPIVFKQDDADNLRAALARLDAVEETLVDVVNQACMMPNGGDDPGFHLHSMALSSYADALRQLAKMGRVTLIEDGPGRHVKAWWREQTSPADEKRKAVRK